MLESFVTWAAWGATAALVLALSACGGGGGTASPTASASNAQGTSPGVLKRNPMGVLIPLYAYPLSDSGTRAAAWAAVEAQAAAVPTVAIINPSNGPVACTSPASATLTAFLQGIAQLHAAGVTVLGYVHTSYGQRDQALVQQDVQSYAPCYGLDGIFFDEVSGNAAYASYDAAVAATVRQAIVPASGKPALVAINPGTYPDISIANTADITVMHESMDLSLPPVPAGLSSYPASKFAYLALGISNLSQAQAASLSNLFQQGVGYVDLTDQGQGTDPWANLTTDYPGLIQAVQALNQTIKSLALPRKRLLDAARFQERNATLQTTVSKTTCIEIAPIRQSTSSLS